MTAMVAASVAGDTIQKLTHAAYVIIAKQGIVGLTLDAVARGAGMSKGALTHHFRSKSDLAGHVLRDALAMFEGLVEQHRDGDTTPGAWTRAYLTATLDERYHGSGHAIAPLLAPAVRSAQLQKIFREAVVHWTRRIEEDGIDRITARILCSAADGCWWSEITGSSLFSDQNERRLFLDRLLAMTRPNAA